ncbi:hypothetical protein NDU88_006181 [Pleurodeles waltl]|uniref:Uncharacterized protein n=1 Tax=Pleurodeles waltl TaxID=8319 RepID=A0AAV7SNV0_PLEWA|nr:hypothetical protein NDU88_006181 [Pleurodeles waltl]
MTPPNGVCRAASTARKSACPVPWATEMPEPPSGTRISGFPTELKGRTDYTLGDTRRTRKTKRTRRQQDERKKKKTPRTRKGRRPTTAVGTGTVGFPRKQPTSGEPKGMEIHTQTAMPQEECG